jgi:hypothetical protein
VVLTLALGCNGSFGCNGDTVSTTAASGTPSGPGSGGAGGMGIGGEPSWIVPTGSGGCDSILYDPPDQPASHVDECSQLDHWSNPPTAGDHYPRWAAFKTYAEPIPRGYYVHSMEHGAVLLLHNCPGGCDAADLAAMQTFVNSLPLDPLCPGGMGAGGGGGAPSTGGAGGVDDGPVKRRVIIVPDPDLDVPFAVAAWGHMLKAQCFDEAIVRPFVTEHYAQSYEDICAGGFDPNDPLEEVPPDCGQ